MKIEDEIQSKFSSEHQKCLVNLQLTAIRLGESMQEEMKKYGLTAAQFNVLRILRGQQQKTVSIGLIKERMIERNSDVSRIIDRLLKKNLIERSENQNDRRQKDVRITDVGLSLLANMDELDRLIQAKLGHMSLEEVKTLNNLLDKARSADEY